MLSLSTGGDCVSLSAVAVARKKIPVGCIIPVVGVILLTMILVIVGIVGSGNHSASDSSLACDHFRNVMSDAKQGILTDSELRDKLQQVNGDADIGTSDVQSAATAMLAAITQGDSLGLSDAEGQMYSACIASGN